tara:strand:+ start:922 stop:1677 length:756 start_codon:yes stop_codon:yes gene_type:complete
MKITINNLLVESMIDDMTSLTKMDKSVLKFLHKHRTTYGDVNYWEEQESYLVWDLMKTFSLNDGDYVFKMWNVYKKYGNLLFDDIKNIGNYTPKDYDKAADVIIMNYYSNNVVGKMVYPAWSVKMMEPLETMLVEDMITMEVSHVNHPPILFVDISLSDIKNVSVINADLLTMDEDNLGQYMVDSGDSFHFDKIDHTELRIDPPQNLSDKSLERYFGQIIDGVHEFIGNWDEKITTYYDFDRPDGGWRWEQ